MEREHRHKDSTSSDIGISVQGIRHIYFMHISTLSKRSRERHTLIYILITNHADTKPYLESIIAVLDLTLKGQVQRSRIL